MPTQFISAAKRWIFTWKWVSEGISGDFTGWKAWQDSENYWSKKKGLLECPGRKLLKDHLSNIYSLLYWQPSDFICLIQFTDPKCLTHVFSFLQIRKWRLGKAREQSSTSFLLFENCWCNGSEKNRDKRPRDSRRQYAQRLVCRPKAPLHPYNFTTSVSCFAPWSNYLSESRYGTLIYKK
jgi:hypothetical protein